MDLEGSVGGDDAGCGQRGQLEPVDEVDCGSISEFGLDGERYFDCLGGRIGREQPCVYI